MARDPRIYEPVPSAAPSTTWDEVVRFLMDPATHRLSAPPTRIDTHAAVVVLAGPLAYKVKRPVRFPFLDFSTLEHREAACRREIAVDRPIAPEIYRRVVAITREADGRPALDGAGEPIEWAVEMNRFDETATLDRRLERGPLPDDLVDALAATVARAEARAPRREAEPWIADLGRWIDQNAVAFAAAPDLFATAPAGRLADLSRARLADLGDLLATRGRLGYVRLGHGDLHTANIAVIDGRPRPFDAVEFDDRVATGDVLYDAGFLVMDLVDRGDRAGARRLLDRLLVESARLEAEARIRHGAPPTVAIRAGAFLDGLRGLAALGLFLSIRAGLRAKIAAARALRLDGAERAAAETEARRLFAAALRHLEPVTPRLVAIGGLSGSGKSTLARALAPVLAPAPGAVVLRSDEIRKLLAGFVPTARLGPEHYTPEASAGLYEVMEDAARSLLAAGRSVIVDAASLRPAERDALAALARAAEVPFTGIWLDIDEETALARVSERSGDASDADAAVVLFQRGLDLGPLDWHRLEASGSPEATLAAAHALLGETAV